jgi:hypothetical protein
MDKQLITSLPKAVIHILKPIIRILMRNDISHAEFSALAKQAYIDVAHKYFSIPNKKMTNSRVAVLTGINRKEVLRLSRIKEESGDTLEGTPNRAKRVVNGWLNDPDFLDKNNNPLILSIKDANNSFAELATRYSGDITIGAIIDELERIGVVKRLNNEQIQLIEKAYIPQTGELEKIDILSTCVTDLLSSAVYNLDADVKQGEGRLQRQLVYKNVPNHVADEFQKLSSKKSQALLEELNSWLAEKTRSETAIENTAKNTKTTEPDKPIKKRVGLGLYYFENDID